MQETYHFVGLGGIGMSALARVLMQEGHSVQGSDKQPSTLLDELKSEGAAIQIGHSCDLLSSATQVVYSSDIKQENIELRGATERHLPLLHRSDLLNALLQKKKALLVTGTHGKTTVTSLLASTLSEAGLDPSFVIGGIHQQWKTNGRAGKGEYFIAEADESDGSFLKSPSYGAIVTNLENDHLDYWQSPEGLDRAFLQFFKQAKHAQHLFWCGDDERLTALLPKGVSYGFKAGNQLQIISWEETPIGVRFDLVWKKRLFNLYAQSYSHNSC